MVEQFFAITHKESGLFVDMSIWRDEKYRNLQGTYPVILLSFSSIKETSFIETRKKICKTIQLLYRKYDSLLESDVLSEGEKVDFLRGSAEMKDYEASLSLQQLSAYLFLYYGRKVLILLDEYDTPMQEAYVDGYWTELSAFIRNLFNATFKGNQYLERAIMRGGTRVSNVYFELSGYEGAAHLLANTSSNRLVAKLIREGSKEIKQNFETLLCGGF